MPLNHRPRIPGFNRAESLRRSTRCCSTRPYAIRPKISVKSSSPGSILDPIGVRRSRMFLPLLVGLTGVLAQVPPDFRQVSSSPVDRLLIGYRRDRVVPSVIPAGKADHRQELHDLTLSEVFAQRDEMFRLDAARYRRGITGEPECRLFGRREITGSFECPDVADPIRRHAL